MGRREVISAGSCSPCGACPAGSALCVSLARSSGQSSSCAQGSAGLESPVLPRIPVSCETRAGPAAFRPR